MTPEEALARRRYFIMRLVELGGVAGAILGVALMARSFAMGPRLLGGAIVLSAMAVIAIVPRSLARRWKSRP